MLSVDAVLEFLNKKNLVKSVLFVGSVFDLFSLKAFQFVCFFHLGVGVVGTLVLASALLPAG